MSATQDKFFYNNKVNTKNNDDNYNDNTTQWITILNIFNFIKKNNQKMSEYICKFIIFAVNIVLILFLKNRYQINLEACIGILKSIDLHIPFLPDGTKRQGEKGGK